MANGVLGDALDGIFQRGRWHHRVEEHGRGVRLRLVRPLAHVDRPLLQLATP
jgi:hypothetical protein